ncbi:sushi, von Willebrand factor type A, EGF and pentraxin domain-containing protein 1-like isoform X2 [Strongylocentrotus purpuratus]|uniref:Uncharacterized protein n=1 Tax=Strongylocentrotus purpuratus TaxID=7668 RepID=A0A7M7P2K8_STRPU|nr:sushi, von Willebrand factor type A, EGF and pentraxin domain-containing protein 1-like isoform X2 [Strongylocentrotus purpuratus]
MRWFLLLGLVCVAKANLIVPACEDPGEIDNGNKQGTSFFIGDKVTYSCNANYRMDGKAELTCSEVAKLTFEFQPKKPSCELLSCGDAPVVENGVGKPSATPSVPGSTAWYDCDDGYRRDGPGDISCQDDETWQTAPTCIQKTCGDIDVVVNGAYAADTIPATPGTQATLSCDAGYEAVNSSPIDCEATDGGNGDPSWTGVSSCRFLSCGDAPVVENGVGKPSATPSVPGSTAWYDCDDGYRRDGPGDISCQDDETWQTAPTCIQKTCGDIDVVVNGAYAADTIPATPGTQATLSCDAGYEAVDSSPIDCEATDGGEGDPSWTTLSSCEEKTCGDIGVVVNGAYAADNDPATAGTTATLTCEPGYEAADSTPIDCKETNGGEGDPSWTTLSSCEEKTCGDIGVVVNGAYAADNDPATAGTTATLTCEPGYEAADSTPIDCKETNGGEGDPSWTTLSSCEEKTCGDIGVVVNGAYAADNDPATAGTTATLTCEPGYEAADSTPIDCKETNGGEGDPSWTTLSSCEEKTCGDIGVVVNGAYAADNDPATAGTTATLTCEPGYEAADSTPIDCKETNGGEGDPSWTTLSSCEDKTCPAFEAQEDITINLAAGENYREINIFAMTATDEGSGLRDVICTPEPGTYPAGAGPCVVSCTATDNAGNSCDGSYTINLVKAAVKSCGVPPQVDNGKVKASAEPSIAGSTTAWYDCNDGYKLEGLNDIECQDDATWQEAPECIAVAECPLGFIRDGPSGRCFKLVTDQSFFDAACKRCKAEGGFLALASTTEQAQEVTAFLSAQQRSANHWINLNQLCGSWQTTEFAEASSSITWRNNNNADCAASNRSGLAQICCWKRLPAVCEAS